MGKLMSKNLLINSWISAVDYQLGNKKGIEDNFYYVIYVGVRPSLSSMM